MEDGYTNEQLFEFTNMDPWFLAQFRGLHQVEEWLKTCKLGDLSFDDMYEVKRKGFSDAQLARFFGEQLACNTIDSQYQTPTSSVFGPTPKPSEV